MQTVEADDTTVPLNDVNFKLTLDCKHEGGHYFKVKCDWFQAGPPAADGAQQQIYKQVIDSGFLKEWTLIQIEGEEAVEAVVEDAKAPAKGKAPPAKGAPKGGGALEEITDNRPMEKQFIKNFGEESGAVKVTEDLARYFENFLLNVSIWQVDRETQEETWKEAYDLDMSPLLFETKTDAEINWKFDKL